MNSGTSNFAEFVRLCSQRITSLFAFAGGGFVLVFLAMLIFTPDQYVFRGQIRVVAPIEAATVSDQASLTVLSASVAKSASAMIMNTQTVGMALTETHLTDLDATAVAKQVSAYPTSDGSDTIELTVVFNNDETNGVEFMQKLMRISCEKISQDNNFGSTDFKGEISEPGRRIAIRSRFGPAITYAGMTAGAAALLFFLSQFFIVVADKTLRPGDKFIKFSKAPVIAAIPAPSRLTGDGGNKVTNAYRVLRSAVKYSGDKVRTVAICSASPKDGRTSAAIGLATALAETDAMVLLIEADMRRPNISMEMHLDSTFGLADLLLGKTNLAATICKTSNRNLYVITAVNNTNLSSINVADLLDSVVFDELLEAVANQFDYVVIDTPAVEVVPDATSVIGKVDCAVAVAQFGHTRVDSLRSAIDIFEASGGHLLGVVTTNSPVHSGWFGSVTNYYKNTGPRRARGENPIRKSVKKSKLSGVFNMIGRK